jgi:hypothetical protein
MSIDPIAWWTSTFGEIPPRGHLLRGVLSDNWTRFHSLPESKRYAENAVEYSELSYRHLTVTGELFEKGQPIYVFRSLSYEKKLKGKTRHQLCGRQFREEMVALPVEQNALDEGERYFVRALVSSWVPDFFSELTLQVADEKVAGITIVSPTTRNIYCPYDGGMDIFAFSKSPSYLEKKFSTWMSLRSDKM